MEQFPTYVIPCEMCGKETEFRTLRSGVQPKYYCPDCLRQRAAEVKAEPKPPIKRTKKPRP